jgi:hypothetical protein
MQVHGGPFNVGCRFCLPTTMGKQHIYVTFVYQLFLFMNIILFFQYSYQLKNCGFTRWVDPPAIDPYQTYIAKLEEVINKLKHELAEALCSPDTTRTSRLEML